MSALPYRPSVCLIALAPIPPIEPFTKWLAGAFFPLQIIRMRTVEMTAFSTAGFSCDTEDKGFGYTTPILEEPLNDLFDQYLTHTITDLGDHGDVTNDVDFFDLFTDGDTTSSASYATDSTSSVPFQPKQNAAQDRSRDDTSSLTKTAFLPQNFHSRGRREKLVPAVSGLELLLEIEGQANSRPHCQDPPHSAPATLTSLPLRRKPRFNKSKPKDLQDRDHRISKSSAYPAKDQSNMIRPHYNYRVESPQSQEWAHGLDQLSLNSAADVLFTPSPNPLLSPSQQGRSSTSFQPRHVTLRDRFFQGENQEEYDASYTITKTESNVDTTSGRSDLGLERGGPFSSPHQYIHNLHSLPTTPQRQPRHSSSWAPSVSSSSDATFTFSSSQAESTWNHGLPDVTTSCYMNGYASKSAPALPHHSSAEFSVENSETTTDIANAFMGVDPNAGYLVGSQEMLPFDFNPNGYPPSPEIHPCPPFPPEQSPSRRTSSPSAQLSPTRNRRRSKSTQRRKSAGNLKSAKSSLAMDFVNFTPSDSKRILTGVAPSGSSKTKARREQEANEKKRKLSLAVLKAVEEAGGDPEPLRKEGLLIDR
ncbi:MAG: hypothetical protein Q9170_003416 [Blastenia crenularia]